MTGKISDAQAAGWLSVNLGVTHLRAETAAIIIPSIVIYAWS
jgi:16S rRNA U1498 N3-methylase RsmE